MNEKKKFKIEDAVYRGIIRALRNMALIFLISLLIITSIAYSADWYFSNDYRVCDGEFIAYVYSTDNGTTWTAGETTRWEEVYLPSDGIYNIGIGCHGWREGNAINDKIINALRSLRCLEDE